MGITLMFMILASVAPYLLYQINKKWLAGVQSILVIGMWFYGINISLMGIEPAIFSLTWTSFYLSFILAEVAWIMFIIYVVKNTDQPAINKTPSSQI